mgnify:CR=1 FL=1
MSAVTLSINGQDYTIDVPPDMPLLWALRDVLNLTGTKYSCGIGTCGTCTVLMNGTPMRSCVMPAIAAAGTEITTIEGLDPEGNHPVQQAWNDEDVPQCGYCQGGQVLAASALLDQLRHDGPVEPALRVLGVTRDHGRQLADRLAGTQQFVDRQQRLYLADPLSDAAGLDNLLFHFCRRVTDSGRNQKAIEL